MHWTILQASFESMGEWIAEVRKYAPDEAVLMLVGNKVDLVKEDETLRCVTAQVSKKIRPHEAVLMLLGNKVDLVEKDETLKCLTSQGSNKIRSQRSCTNARG